MRSQWETRGEQAAAGLEVLVDDGDREQDPRPGPNRPWGGARELRRGAELKIVK